MKTNLPLAVARDVANQLVGYLKSKRKRLYAGPLQSL